MTLISQALWRIETKLREELNLDDLAAHCGVSRFHLARAFSAVVGAPPMAYARARRLSEAAKELAAGAPDILQVALDWSYGSHEAFTRAFREQFGVTPEQARTAGLSSLSLTEPFVMTQPTNATLATPRFIDRPALLLAGFSERFDCKGPNPIPALWARFAAHIGTVPNQIGEFAYGVNYNFDDQNNMDHLAGVEVSSFDGVPPGYARLRLAPQTYAVFTHKGHVSAIRTTWGAIWSDWAPKSGCETVDAPNFELYDQRFDPATGQGEVEIWIPVRRAP